MAISLTRLIYPIKEEIVISKELGYVIDNPRTDSEIKFIHNFIRNSLPPTNKEFQEYNQSLALGFGISDMRKFLKDKDEYAHSFFESNYETPLYEVISKSWIIIRYSDEKEFEEVLKDKRKLFGIGMRKSSEANPFVDNFIQAVNYCHLISVLINDEDNYHGDSISFLKDPVDIFYQTEDYQIFSLFEDLKITLFTVSKNEPLPSKWLYFPAIKEKLLETCKRIDELLSIKLIENKRFISKRIQLPKDKLLFVGNLLRTVNYKTEDIKIKLLILVTIIEFLLTRTPDQSRFNVEDSIRKQFILKTAVILFQNSNKLKINDIKKELDRIYSQRSDVAHGNYIPKAEEDSFAQSTLLLYKYIRSIIEEYLKNPDYIEFIKGN